MFLLSFLILSAPVQYFLLFLKYVIAELQAVLLISSAVASCCSLLDLTGTDSIQHVAASGLFLWKATPAGPTSKILPDKPNIFLYFGGSKPTCQVTLSPVLSLEWTIGFTIQLVLSQVLCSGWAVNTHPVLPLCLSLLVGWTSSINNRPDSLLWLVWVLMMDPFGITRSALYKHFAWW